jgi:hypothetical protein
MFTLARTLLDRAERMVWERHDGAMRAAGWEVNRLGRWRRSYRHPARLAAAIAARQAEEHGRRRHRLVPMPDGDTNPGPATSSPSGDDDSDPPTPTPPGRWPRHPERAA